MVSIEVSMDSRYLHWFIANFKFESSEQQKGFLNLVQYLRKHCPDGYDPTFLIASYFIQKDHESNEHWIELVGNQISNIQLQLKSLIDENQDLKARLASLEQNCHD
jgi:hypothetical protein